MRAKLLFILLYCFFLYFGMQSNSVGLNEYKLPLSSDLTSEPSSKETACDQKKESKLTYRGKTEITDEVLNTCKYFLIESFQPELDLLFMKCMDDCLNQSECNLIAGQYCRHQVMIAESAITNAYFSCVFFK